MFRLAYKVGLDELREKAFTAIWRSLDAGNILQEISSSFTSKYPAILQMEVDILVQHIDSVNVILNTPSLLKRIARSESPHGSNILINLHREFLSQYHSQALEDANWQRISTVALPYQREQIEYLKKRR